MTNDELIAGMADRVVRRSREMPIRAMAETLEAAIVLLAPRDYRYMDANIAEEAIQLALDRAGVDDARCVAKDDAR